MFHRFFLDLGGPNIDSESGEIRPLERDLEVFVVTSQSDYPCFARKMHSDLNLASFLPISELFFDSKLALFLFSHVQRRCAR